MNNPVSDNKVLQPVIAILLILFTVFMAPKLSISTTKIIDNTYFKLFFIIVIILLAKKHLSISLICLIIFFIILNNSSNKQKEIKQEAISYGNKIGKLLKDLKQLNTDAKIPFATVYPSVKDKTESNIPFATLHPSVNGKTVPDIPISVAVADVSSYNGITNSIVGSAVPITSNITPSAAKTIVSTNDVCNNIISNIKNNNSEYTKNISINEQTIRNQASKVNDPNESQQLNNTADKLATAREAVTSIVNNKDVETNHELLKSLVKSDLLKNASTTALKSGDELTALQLDQASLSHSNVANSLIQSNILKSTGQYNLSDAHLKASLNMISYNNNMEMSLDAFNKGDYILSKKYHDSANAYLDNNITLNDKIKGFVVENSNKIYEKTPTSNTKKYDSKIENDIIVNINGLENYEYANF